MATIYNNKNNNFLHHQIQWNINRANAIPVDNYSIWNSFNDLSDYALSSPVSYVGQILTYSPISGDSVSSYQIVDENGTLKRILNTQDYSEIRKVLESDFVYLSGNNIGGHEISGNNKFLDLNIFENISSDYISCNFNTIYTKSDEKLCSLIDKIDDNPSINDCILRIWDFKDYCGLTGYYIDSFNPYTDDLDKVVKVTAEIHEKVTGETIAEPTTCLEIKNILDNLIDKATLKPEARTLEFRLKHLNESNNIILQRLQNTDKNVQIMSENIQTMQSNINYLNELVGELSSVLRNQYVIVK